MKPFLRILIFPCIFLFAACSGNKANQVSVLSHNFTDEVQLKQNLVFTFNKDLYPDSLLNQWDSTDYITFSPAVAGHFKWNYSHELVFSPEEGFAPGTVYTATLTDKLLKKVTRNYHLSQDKEFHFHTPYLQVTGASVSWTRGKTYSQVAAQLDLDFNYPVNVMEAAKNVTITSKGEPVHFNLAASGTGKVVSLQFPPLNDEDAEIPIEITIKKGIRVTGTYVTKNDTAFSALVPSRYNLSIEDISAQHDGAEGTVSVTTSQPVPDSGLEKLINIEPAVKFEVKTTDEGFMITSKDFAVDKTYQVDISAKLEGLFGGKMKAPFSQPVGFGELQPDIRFANSKGMYLSAQGYRNVAVQIVSVPKVKVSVVKVYQNNIEQLMSRGSYGRYYNTRDLGDTVFTREYITKSLEKQNAIRLLHLDFEDKIKDFKGIYIVTVASADHYWVRQSKIISISDIGLIVKQGKNHVYVFANSLKSATPLSGVKIGFISSTNQVMHTAVTNNDGMAELKEKDSGYPEFEVAMVTAQSGDDFNMVLMDQSKVETSRFDVGGATQNETGLNAMIYGERNLYRPGETIHVSAIVRDDQWRSPGEIPVKLQLVMPNGKEYMTLRKVLNEEGACETYFKIPATALTGTYVLRAYTGNDVLLNTYDISVEEFMPDRIKVNLKLDHEGYMPGDTVKALVNAQNLFGTPAMNRNYQYELNIDRDNFAPRNLPEYTFSIQGNFSFNPVLREGKTDEKGNCSESFAIPKELANQGLLKGNVTTTVFDETGRPVHRFANFSIFTQPVFLGIKDFDYYVGTNAPMSIGLIAVDKSGKLQKSVTAEATVVKKEWHTVIEQSGNGYRYVSREDEKLMVHRKVQVGGDRTAFYFTPEISGEYELRVSLPGSHSYVSRSFYAYGWGDTQFTSFEVNNEGNVSIKLDKEKYNPGEQVKALFTTPFDGNLLVTVERDHVSKYYYLTTDKKTASLSFKAESAFVPNVYITATLIRPMDNSPIPLTVAHGFKPVMVEEPANKLPVDISMSAHSRSKTKQTLTVKTMPGAFVTIAAVDEGILQVKNYSSPDPYKYFYQKQALQVNSYDIYPLLLPEIEGRKSSTGGDADEMDLERRVNPVFVNRVKLVSFWSGIKQADGNGYVKYDINIPQFSGDLRVMAVAYKGKAFGASDSHMKVADPVVISTALPRFLSPKDEVIMPVTVSNTTTSNTKATISVKVEGPLKTIGEAQRTVSIKANGEQRAVFKVAAASAIGAGKVTVSVQSMNETFTDQTDISVRPPASLQKRTGSGEVVAGDTKSVTIGGGSFMSGTARGKLIISKSPMVEFADNLDYLVRYPYGCVEQTVSAAFPQLYYHDLVKNIYGISDKDQNPNNNVQQAIHKLQSMQMSNGALSFWPSGGYESWWGSIFAAHFLFEAKRAGFVVNDKTLNRLYDYMKYKLRNRKLMVYYYNEHLKKEIAPREAIYSLYILALSGQSQLSTMNYYKGHPELLSLDSKYMLAAAYALAGDPAKYKDLLPASFSGEKANTSFGGSFYSYLRDEALALNVLLEVDPKNPQISVMARQVSEQLKNNHYINTQENVFSLLALGKIARQANETKASATVTANGKVVASTEGENLVVDADKYLNQPLEIQVKGAGRYYYFYEASGIPSDGSYKEEDSYLQVRRTYYDRNGQQVAGNRFRQNDLVVVKISISTQYNGEVDNVAITDMLPAGFEIENPRLGNDETLKWIKDAARPDYVDYRDDRINLFTSVGEKTKNFYYMVRAVSPGTYQQGPVQADAMYNGQYHSYNGAGIIEVTDE